MDQVTQQPPVQQVDPLSHIDGGTVMIAAPPAPALDAPIPPDNGQAVGKDVQVAKEAVAPTTPEVPVVEDPYVKLVDNISTPAPTIEWSEEAKTLFKQTFGAEDPLKFKEEWAKRQEEIGLAQNDANYGRSIKEQIEAMPPAFKQAFLMALEGKDAVNYLRSLPNEAILSKPSKEMTAKQLIDTYLADKVSPDVWAALAPDADVDEAVKAAAQQVVNMYHPVAANLHDQKLAEVASGLKAQQEAQQQTVQAWGNSVAAAVAQARSTPFGSFIDQSMIDGLNSGELLGNAFYEKGVLKPEALTTYLKGVHYDKSVEAARTSGYNKGKQDGLLEAQTQMPSAPRGGRQNIPADGQPTNPPGSDLLDMIQQGVRR